jgi:hypothetical protein
MLPALAVIIFFDKLITAIKLFLRRSLHLPVFYSAHKKHHNIHRHDKQKWECNVQNNRAWQYDMICDEIF